MIHRTLLVLLFLLFFTADGLPALKKKYGGNLRVAEELLTDVRIFDFPFKVQQTDNSLQADLSFLNPDQLVEIEKHLQALQDSSHVCHWVLDYPFLDHQHVSSIVLENGMLALRGSNHDSLRPLLSSSCLLPFDWLALQPFRKTQFGYEANWECMAGRPFLDSITPVPVDPINPYLSFKLKDVDIIPVPEDRFHQIAADPEISLIPGLKYFLYLKSSGLSSVDVSEIIAAINLTELARTAFNEHAEMIIPVSNTEPSGKRFALRFDFPAENPYRLMGERLELQLKDAGFTIAKTARDRSLTLAFTPFVQPNEDMFRYHLLKAESQADSRPWLERWDDLQRSGRLIPLMVHISQIAYRKNIQELITRPSGMPDLANCWLLQQP